MARESAPTALPADPVARVALGAQRLALRGEVEAGLAELEAGDSVRGTADELAVALREGCSFEAVRVRVAR